MYMILNDVLTKQNLITKIKLENGDKALPKALKVKIMRIRMAYNKIKQQFEADVQEFTQDLISKDMQAVIDKTDKTEEDLLLINSFETKINAEYQEFILQKGNEKVTLTLDDSFNLDEYSDILDINSGNHVLLNETEISAEDFMEAFYSFFVNDN